VRLVHWALVLDIAALWWTGTERLLDWHRLAGYAMAALVLFRLAWGFVGSDTARFASFVQGPRRAYAYLRDELFDRHAPPHFGHNPLGGWSVAAMLGLLATQVALGTLAVDVDGIESGPFSYLVEFDTGRAAAEWHHLLFNVLLGLIALHIVAVVFYATYRRHNLVATMVTGSRPGTGHELSDRFVSVWVALAIMLLSAGLVWASVKYLGQV